MRRLSKLVILAGVLPLTALGCGLAGGSGYDEFAPEPSREVTLTVTNQNFYDATLHAVWPSYRVRLGVVSGNTEKTFTFRWERTELRILIGLQSVGTQLTQVMAVDPGDELELVIDPSLDKRIRLARRRGGQERDLSPS
jgi:hypothetical protein